MWKFKQFYLGFKDLQILPMASAESTHLLSWSHYERLMRVADADARSKSTIKVTFVLPSKKEEDEVSVNKLDEVKVVIK